MLAQRYVDRLRAQRRIVPLPEEDAQPSARCLQAAGIEFADPDRSRRLALVRAAFGRVIAGLTARDRLRLGCYYLQQLTLAETGRILKEHQATVSRQLTRTRAVIRDQVIRHLRDRAGLSADEIADCFESITEDPGDLDLDRVLRAAARKEPAQDRSV